MNQLDQLKQFTTVVADTGRQAVVTRPAHDGDSPCDVVERTPEVVARAQVRCDAQVRVARDGVPHELADDPGECKQDD